MAQAQHPGTYPKGGNETRRPESLKDKIGDALEEGRSGLADSATAAKDDLGDDMAKLRKDVAHLQQTLTRFISEAGSEAMKTARTVGSEVATSAGEMASSAKDQVKSMTSELEGMARRNPLGTIGATLLIGVVLGMMSRRSRS